MFKRLLPLALSAPMALTACWAQAPTTVTQMTGTHKQIIDLTKGAPKAGFGRMTIQVPVAAKGTRGVQAIGPNQRLIVVITKGDGTEVTDENGHDAVYSNEVSGGVASVTLPGLPPTTTETSGPLSANAYTVTTLIGNWDNATLPADYTYDAMAGTGWGFDYGNRSEGKFTFEDLGGDLIPSTDLDGSDEATEFPNGRLQRSGFGRADITSGVETTITVSNFEHIITNFVNSLAFDAAKARANVTSLTGLVADDDGKVRVRHPGLALDTIDPSSGERMVRFVVSLQDDGSKTMSSAPAMSINKFDAAAGTYAATLTAPGFSSVLTSSANAGFSSLDSEMAYADATLTSVNANAAAANIVDFEFDLGAAMAGATVRLYALPLGTNGVMSGAFAPSIFE